MEKTAEILKKHGYLCTYDVTKQIKGIDKPVKVYTLDLRKARKSNNIHMLRRGSIAVPTTESLMNKLKSNPTLKKLSSTPY